MTNRFRPIPVAPPYFGSSGRDGPRAGFGWVCATQATKIGPRFRRVARVRIPLYLLQKKIYIEKLKKVKAQFYEAIFLQRAT